MDKRGALGATSLLCSSLFLASACGPEGPDPDISAVKRRATFELDCDKKEVKAFWIDDNTIGVRGCGQRLVYVQVCNGLECKWVLNSNTTRRAREE